MSAVDQVTNQLSTYATNLNNQVHSAFARMTAQDYIRLIIIVGAYALLRPYLLKLGGKYQQQDHEREIDPEELACMKKNVIRDRRDGSLRERADVPEDTDSDSEEQRNTASADWGKKARRRQRRVIRTLLEQEEQRKREAEEQESDKEIEDLLVE